MKKKEAGKCGVLFFVTSEERFALKNLARVLSRDSGKNVSVGDVMREYLVADPRFHAELRNLKRVAKRKEKEA
jgi:hypothetical protein